MPIADLRVVAITAVASIVVLGTAYSVQHNTYLDTSNPHITSLPHPLHASHYFASKSNPLNVYFIKKAWGWTSLAFLALFFTLPPSEGSIVTARSKARGRLLKWLVETAVWGAFVGWFFGPALLERLIAASGGECVVVLPTGYVLQLPVEACLQSSAISPATHPSLFAASLMVPEVETWKARPRLRRGHDVSGHVFLLTMGSLFLVDQIRMSLATKGRWSQAHKYAVSFAAVVLGLSLFAVYTTSIYFHTPLEKISGLGEHVSDFGFIRRLTFPCPLSTGRCGIYRLSTSLVRARAILGNVDLPLNRSLTSTGSD
ncbi:hypothetical protein PUNSTDRAFT_62199 [Punctularia strigosozonata HHB-11173 SS5]|uniref:uncharacterized protein n=1 Tax=Punctularia strigosozonata (strain HHB-11173) TaxID=741275 RepID=UPI00044178D2|nr:uncharacterized protein PUNSTDRAFT_62199 [Punctularia strigosozonata HHB-11173 SS5]EIN11278.1 hypothetical protein PUNSTDRAFT_62199 [Punctularia strigosozonata HHB-11173 SS5]